MKKHKSYVFTISVCCIAAVCLMVVTILGNRAITVISQNASITPGRLIIIDAGHGGVDGGATSCTGVLESQINLEIALRLEDLLHLLGIHTKMVRTTDRSIYTSGETIAAKKVSDLKERVRIVNETDGAILISIHQNYFSDSKYTGAQAFYGSTAASKELATALQTQLIETLNIGSNRTPKQAKGIFLMEHIQQCGVLLECGFLSNPSEEAKLRDAEYQKQLCCVISSVLSNFLTE